ncbi:hypothetical protein ACWDA7_38855 [Streptomyces sp. NPDC001156]
MNACTHWIGAEQRYCHSTENVREYLSGLCCPLHTPAALRGLPEPEPGPGMPAGAWTTPSPLSDSRVHDARAVASGKRRANPREYRAAQAAVGQRPELQPAPIRIDVGQQDARGRRIRVPTADYRCPACQETESASGDQVAHFAKHIEAEHAERCTADPQGAQA